VQVVVARETRAVQRSRARAPRSRPAPTKAAPRCPRRRWT
jgi:hypothetical protein